jgi:hypothetical protein
MYPYRVTTPAARRAAALATICVTGLSLAACSGGITTASPPASSPPASSPAAATTPPASSASPPASPASGSGGASTPATGSGTTVTVGGSLGTFPIPPGAQVVANVDNSDGQDAIQLSGVQPSELSSFYSTALPQAGYTITSNDVASEGVVTGAGIEFAGHGYKGDIGDADGIIGITLTPQ